MCDPLSTPYPVALPHQNKTIDQPLPSPHELESKGLRDLYIYICVLKIFENYKNNHANVPSPWHSNYPEKRPRCLQKKNKKQLSQTAFLHASCLASALHAAIFACRRFLDSPAGHRWQWLHSAPFRQPWQAAEFRLPSLSGDIRRQPTPDTNFGAPRQYAPKSQFQGSQLHLSWCHCQSSSSPLLPPSPSPIAKCPGSARPAARRSACGFQNQAQGLQVPVPCKIEPKDASGTWSNPVGPWAVPVRGPSRSVGRQEREIGVTRRGYTYEGWCELHQ